MIEEDLLAELALVLDQLNELPDSAITERFELRSRQARLRSELAEAQGQRRVDAEAEWAEQAGRRRPPDEGDTPIISGGIRS